MVRKQAASDRILDGSNAKQFPIGPHAGEELVETRAGEGLDLLSGEEFAGGRVVEASGDALYGDSFHLAFGVKKRESRSSKSGIPSCLSILFFTTSVYAHAIPLFLLP